MGTPIGLISLHKMEERNLSHLPVVDREMRIVGLVAYENLRTRLVKAGGDHTEVGTVTQGTSIRRLRIRGSASLHYKTPLPIGMTQQKAVHFAQ